MHFLEPMGLLGLAALVPIIALYFLKLRREERVVPSTLLWKKVIEDLHVNAPFQRIRYSLLLLLQLLLVALLGFALARPFLSMSGMQSKRLVILIDTSASMGTRDAGPKRDRTRLEEAVRIAKTRIDDLGRDGEARLVAFDEEPRQLTRFSSDAYFLKDKLDQLEVRHLRTRAQEALELALTLSEERANSQVLILSDGAFERLNLARLLGDKDALNKNQEELSMARLTKVQYYALGRDDSDNVGITNINARTRTVQALNQKGEESEALETQVFVTVENFGSEDKDVILSLSAETQNFQPTVIKLKARPRGDVTLSDDPEQGHTLEASRAQKLFRLPIDTTGIVTATVTSPKDRFELDNQASIIVGYTESNKVLLVSKGDYFVEKAFKTMPNTTVDKMTPEAFETEWKAKGANIVKDFDAVLFHQYAPQRWEDGGAVFIGVLPPLPGFKKSDDEKPREFPLIIDWDNAHPVMRYVNFGNVQIKEAPRWIVPKTATTLVEAAGGPLVMAYATDRVHVVGVVFDFLDSDIVLRASLPIFIRNAILWAAEVSPRRRPTMQKTGSALSLPPVSSAPSAILVWPDGKRREVKLSTESKELVGGTNTQGIYRLTGLPGSVKDELLYAVNLADPHESDNLARQKIEIGSTQESDIESSVAAVAARNEFWRTLVMIAVAVLMLEWWVYHRRLGA